ncbi:MAG: SEL1-like repeat protein [Proteobacteria bacterium]|nr:SEL1-like repeat protein [Pseudomonadota bacterium]
MKRLLILVVLLLGLASNAWADLVTGARAYRDGEYATALTEFRALAIKGDALAQYALGLMYTEGVGVSKDPDIAVGWYDKAARQGLAQAQYNLAVAHHMGVGTPRNFARAAHWYRMAAEQDDARSQNNLGYLYEKGRGVPQDDVQAADWYRRAAELGNTNAQVNLANSYRRGRGVPKDREEAMVWFRKAVDKWETKDPLKLWIVDAGGTVKPYSEAVGAGPAMQTAELEESGLPGQTPAAAAPVYAEDVPASPTVAAAIPEPRPVEEASAPAPRQAPAAAPKQQFEAIEEAYGGVGIDSGFRVQLGAFSNPQNAQRGWELLRDAHPDLLGDMTIDVSLHINKVDLGAERGVVFRVQAGPFAQETEARSLCGELKNREVGCFLILP